MTATLYLDPGVQKHASALFIAGLLFEVSLDSPAAYLEPLSAGSGIGLSELVIEKPQIYPGSDEKDPNDCLDVFGAARLAEGGIRARGGPAAQYVLPREWKGQIDKPPHHARIWMALSAGERTAFARSADQYIKRNKVEKTWPLEEFIAHKIDHACALLAQHGEVRQYSWQAHNLLDAVGIGLWHLGRTGRGGRRH